MWQSWGPAGSRTGSWRQQTGGCSPNSHKNQSASTFARRLTTYSRRYRQSQSTRCPDWLGRECRAPSTQTIHCSLGSLCSKSEWHLVIKSSGPMLHLNISYLVSPVECNQDFVVGKGIKQMIFLELMSGLSSADSLSEFWVCLLETVHV